MASTAARVLTSLLLAASSTSAIHLDVNSVGSVSSAAKTVASSVMELYNSNITGLFSSPYNISSPYNFWESGQAFDSMINYWALTGDTTYNSLVTDALLFQRGMDNDVFPVGQKNNSESNDAVSSWALAAMTAAERGLPLPVNASWVELAQTVFEAQAARWDEATCGGGLRWQIFSFNDGYSYKNSISNGDFVQLAARLALYTGNTTYSDWAQKVAQWSLDLGLISSENGAVYDGTSTTDNCSAVNHIQWTAPAGTYLSGAAYASNKTSTIFWNGIAFSVYVNANFTFAPNGILTEISCAPTDNCDVDQLAFRSVLVRALANMRDLTVDSPVTEGSGCAAVNNTGTSPHCADTGTIHGNINTLLQASAKGAAAQCSGGTDGSTCGSDWSNATWDGTEGLGQSLSVLEIFMAILPPVQRRTVNSTGGTVTGSSSNGTATSSGDGSSSTNTSSGTSTSETAKPNIASSASTFGLLACFGFAVAFFL